MPVAGGATTDGRLPHEQQNGACSPKMHLLGSGALVSAKSYAAVVADGISATRKNARPRVDVHSSAAPATLIIVSVHHSNGEDVDTSYIRVARKERGGKSIARPNGQKPSLSAPPIITTFGRFAGLAAEDSESGNVDGIVSRKSIVHIDDDPKDGKAVDAPLASSPRTPVQPPPASKLMTHRSPAKEGHCLLGSNEKTGNVEKSGGKCGTPPVIVSKAAEKRARKRDAKRKLKNLTEGDAAPIAITSHDVTAAKTEQINKKHHASVKTSSTDSNTKSKSRKMDTKATNAKIEHQKRSLQAFLAEVVEENLQRSKNPSTKASKMPKKSQALTPPPKVGKAASLTAKPDARKITIWQAKPEHIESHLATAIDRLEKLMEAVAEHPNFNISAPSDSDPQVISDVYGFMNATLYGFRQLRDNGVRFRNLVNGRKEEVDTLAKLWSRARNCCHAVLGDQELARQVTGSDERVAFGSRAKRAAHQLEKEIYGGDGPPPVSGR